MKLAAISTFPPSTNPLSSFGYHAVQRFLENPEIEQIAVLADCSSNNTTWSNRLRVEHCWTYNDPFSLLKIIKAILRHQPNIVWLNLQYTSFGSKPIPAFMGLMIPVALKLKKFPVVILLHNYLSVVNLNEMGIKLPKHIQTLLPVADWFAMHSLIKADVIFTMEKKFHQQLRTKYPTVLAELIEHDLYKVPQLTPPLYENHHIMTLGYFGTYKKLETLLEAFNIVRQQFSNAKLSIAGRDSPYTPFYLESLKKRYSNFLQNIEFLGYISDNDLSELYRRSNVIVLTNSANAGSSGVLRLAAIYGRAVVLPETTQFEKLKIGGWGIEYYKLGDSCSLAEILMDILRSPHKQFTLGHANYLKAFPSEGSFTHAHQVAFANFSKKY